MANDPGRSTMTAKVKLIFGIILSLFFFLSTIAYFNIKRFESSTDSIDHCHQIIHSLQKIYAGLKGAQANYADFLLTRKSNYSKACKSDMDVLLEDSKRANELVADDPILRKSMEELQSLIENRLTFIQEGLAYFDAGRSDLAIANLQKDSEKESNLKIKKLVDQMSGMQIWQLKTRKIFEEADSQKSAHFVIISALCALVFCGLAGYFINRQINERQAAMNHLKSSEEKFRFLAETANDSFITTDSTGKITDINPTGETMFGYSELELVGKPLSLLMPQKFSQEGIDLSFEKFVSIVSGVQTLEISGLRKDLSTFPLEVSVSKWETKDGIFYTTISRDITERKFFIKTLLNNEHRLFQFLNAIPLGVLVRDPTGAPYYSNQAHDELFGTDMVKNKTLIDQTPEAHHLFIAGTDVPYPSDQLPGARALLGEKSHVDDIEMRYLNRVIPLEGWGSPILDEKGGVKFALTAIMDVSRQKEITEATKEREEFFRNLFEESPIGMTLTFPDGTFVNVNRAFCDMLGYSKNELLDLSCLDFTFPEDAALEKPLNQKLFEKMLPKYQIETRYIPKKGGLIRCKVSASVMRNLEDEPLFRLAMVENITEQKAAEAELKESEEKFRTLTESANDAIISINSKGIIIFFNPAAEKIFGYSQTEALGRPFSNLMVETSWKANMQLIQNYLVTGKSTIPGRTLELEGRRKNGEEFPAEISYFSWKTQTGLFFTSIMRDITEQKTAELALKESEEKFRAVTDSANDAIVSADSYGKIIYFNAAAARLFGYNVKEVYGRSLTSLLAEWSYRDRLEEFLRAFAGETSNLVGRNTEWTGLTKEGREFPLELSLYTWYTDQGIFVTATLRDITERKQVEEMKNDLISVVSHQLKTPVAEINGYIENMLEGITGDLSETQKEYLMDMRDIGNENYRLISDLLSMSKIERGVMTVDLSPVQLEEIVELATRDYESLVKNKNLKLMVDKAPDDFWVLADKDKTAEALRNIINNAIKCTDQGSIRIQVKRDDSFGLVEVSDTGIGMSETTLQRLFTKSRVLGAEAARAGAGLGLYIAKSFINLQQGDITVISELGKGSTFRVTIPITNKEGERHV
jgi:PAS domain S-box-containing protein